MKAKQIIFTKPSTAELQAVEVDLANLGPNELAIKTHYSLISPGTELACFRGTEGWAKLPMAPGYAGCGEVIATGKDVKDFKTGDMVFSYTKHASHVKTGRMVAKLPAGLESRLAPFARMAAVSITALRVSNAELGDHVAVLGLGLVGNFAAQLFTLAGCEVIGIDPSDRRRELAKTCGARHVIAPAEEDAKKRVAEITKGRMCGTVVEASGAPAVGEKAAQLAGRLGEVILVGSPRGEHPGDITALLNSIHLWGSGCVTFKGAHEWRYPIDRDPNGHVKHSIMRNVDILLRLIAEGRLRVRELLTHVLPPTQCMTAYEGLRDTKDEYLGVLFDWTTEGRG